MKNLIHEEVLMCCGYRKCPTIKLFDDGSIEITDDDTKGGSVGTIKIRAEAAQRLAALIAEQKEF